MILIVLALFLIVGFVIADAIVDYVFIAIYALAVTAIINNIIHMIKYRKKHGKFCTSDICSSFLYFMLGVGAALIHYIWL